jgi:hypothetical protein
MQKSECLLATLPGSDTASLLPSSDPLTEKQSIFLPGRADSANEDRPYWTFLVNQLYGMVRRKSTFSSFLVPCGGRI